MSTGSSLVDGAGVREGDVLAGKYRVDRVLGVGGMGIVVAARHLSLDERVAIKFLLPEAMSSAEAVARFDREARAAVKIKSEHVARVIDVGHLESGAPYMVMEYLDGSDLAAWLAARGRMPVEQAVEFLLQACEAIAEAHAIGIVHRDLKPANIFCIRRPDGGLSVKVLDFGISKFTAPGARDMGMTKTQAIIGSPLYMSPEQMQSSRNVDARTDIWSLGVILFELVTGRVPFEGEVLTELIARIITTQPTPMRGFAPEAPPQLEQAILRCLEKDRERRFATVGDFAAAIAPFGPPRGYQSLERIHGVLAAAGIAAPSAPVPPAGPAPGMSISAAQSPQAMTGQSWGRTGGKTGPGVTRPGAGAAVAVAAAIGLVAVAAGAGAFLYKTRATAAKGAETAPSPGAAFSGVATGEGSAAPGAGSVAELAALPVVAPSASNSPSSPSPAPQLPAAKPAAPSYPAVAAPVHSAAPAHTTTAGCNPPYVVDSAGRRQYRPECL